MTITGADRLTAFASRDAIARKAFAMWTEFVSKIVWKSPADVIRTNGTADPLVRVRSGRRVAVFNVRGNHYRVIAAINYSRQIVDVLRVMTHAEYSRDAWKDQL